MQGAGHIATEHKPDMCVGLIARWITESDIAFLPFQASTTTELFKQFMQSGKDTSFSNLLALANKELFPFIQG